MLTAAREDCRELWRATRALRGRPTNFDVIFASCPSALHDEEAAELCDGGVFSLSRTDLNAGEAAVANSKHVLILDPGPGPLQVSLKGTAVAGSQVHLAIPMRTDLPACLSLDHIRRRLRLSKENIVQLIDSSYYWSSQQDRQNTGHNTRMSFVTLMRSASEPVIASPTIEWTLEAQPSDYCIAVHATHGIVPADMGTRFLTLGLRECRLRTNFTSLIREKHVTKHYAVSFSRITRELLHAVDAVCAEAQRAAYSATHKGVDFELHLLRTPIPVEAIKKLGPLTAQQDISLHSNLLVFPAPQQDLEGEHNRALHRFLHLHGINHAFINHCCITQATPQKWAEVVMAARSEGIDIPDNSQRYAHRYIFQSDPMISCHTFTQVEVAEPCKLRTVDLQVLLPPGIAYTEIVQQDIHTKLGISVSFQQVVQVKLPDTSVRRALHLAVDAKEAPKLLETNLAHKGLPEGTQVGYLCPIVHAQIPQRAYDNPSECPMEHWQAYAQRHGAPVMRLPIANPLHLHDQSGRRRASQCFATGSSCVNGILSNECVPIAALVTSSIGIRSDYFAQPVPECLQCLGELSGPLVRHMTRDSHRTL